MTAAEKAERGVVLESISLQSGGGVSQVILQSSQPLKFRESSGVSQVSLAFQSRTVLQKPLAQKLSNELVEDVKLNFDPKDKSAVSSVTIKLKTPCETTVTQKDWVVKVELRPKQRAGRPSTQVAPPVQRRLEEPLPPVSRKDAKLTPLPSTPNLSDFLRVAYDNHVPLRLADEEYRLAKLRSFEATRALFPSVTGRYTESKGTLLLDPTTGTDDALYRRKEYGLVLGQPIFQSGRLVYSLKSAEMQESLAGHNMAKTKAELTFEVKKAYYNLIKAQRAVKARQDLVGQGEKVLDMTRKKRQLELVTEAETLGVESQFSQIYYKYLSDQKDLDLARLKMAALLNLPNTLPLEVPDPGDAITSRDAPSFDADVNVLLRQARDSRPDLLAAEATARAQHYAEKAAKADGRLRVDASGFIGHGGAAYVQTESIDYERSWNVGVQARYFFFGNSLKGTGSKDRTAPDLGETSATDTNSATGEVGLLDGIKAITDAKQAHIAKERAAMEYDQARRQVEVDVREAYYNMQKAILQLKSSQQERSYREKEANISRQKERLNLVEPTQRISSESAFGEALVNSEEAKAFYQISLAGLEKAVGLPIDSILRTR